MNTRNRGLQVIMVMLMVMLASPITFVHAQAEAQAGHSISLTIYQSARPDIPLQGARIVFTDAHTGNITELRTNAAGQVFFFPPAASSYSILINASGYYDYQYLNPDNKTEFIRFDGMTDLSLRGVFLAQLPQITWPTTLRLIGAAPSGVTVSVTYVDGVEQSAFQGNISSDTIIQLQPGNYRVAYRGPGLQPGATTFPVQGPTTVDLTMAVATPFSAQIYVNSVPAVANAYLVSRQSAELARMIVDTATISMGRVTFDAYPGEFYLLISAPGATAKVANVTLPRAALTVDLAAAMVQSDSLSFQFDSWRNLTVSHAKLRAGGTSDLNLQLSRLPSLRMQLDLSPTVGGNRNGVVDPQEVANYTRILRQIGPEDISTTDLLSVDGGAYLSHVNYLDYSVATDRLENTPVWSEDEYGTELGLAYSPMAAIPVEGKINYLVVLNPAYNTTTHGWNYRVQLPSAYVALGSSVVKDPVTIRWSGYTEVLVFPPTRNSYDPQMAMLYLPVATAKEPSATASVVLSASTYRVDQTTYIVRSGTAVQLSAAGSFDPNSNPLSYTWKFGDGSEMTTSADRVTHVYVDPTIALTATLTVRDVSARTSNASITIKVDGVDPNAEILVNGSAPGPVIHLDQMEAAQFSASPSYDLIFNENPPQGIVKRCDWDFGDGTYANDSLTARHAYTLPGNFTLTSRITDASGRVTTTSYAVQVRDTQAPNVVINIFRVADGTPVSGSAIIGDALLFDGSNSTDPGGIVSYTWVFGDGSGGSGAKAQHSYSSLGTVTGRLTCVDAAGNSAFLPFTLTVLPAPGPDLRITDMSFSPTTFIEATSGTVRIEMVNVGSAVAYNISTGFYLVRPEGNTLLMQVRDMTVNGLVVDHLDIGQSGIVSASLSFATQGGYTVLANATADGELNPGDNSRSATVQVQESAWKYAGVYFGIICLVVVLAVLLYMRRGLTTKKKGQRGRKRKK